ncbi:hypothetical protein D9M69_717250 [compost metagenome]
MAVVATFPDVDVAAFQLQCGVGLHAFDRLGGHVLEEQRNDLGEAADTDCQGHAQSQQTDVLFEYFMFHGRSPQAICAAACISAGLAALTVRKVL